MLPKIDGVIKNLFSILHSDDALKTLLPKDCFSTISKSKKKWKKWLHHLFTLKKTLEQAVLQVIIIVIFARITWFLILTLFAQSLVSLIL